MDTELLKKAPNCGTAVILLVSLCSALCLFSYFWSQENNPYTVPWKYTDPLPTGVINDLCKTFDLSQEDRRCSGEQAVFATDFSGEIDEMVKNGELLTFSDWDSTFGEYQTYCSHSTPEYQCDYDFHGDDIFLVVVVFDTRDIMVRWKFTAVDENLSPK